jgi:hypothetical protein
LKRKCFFKKIVSVLIRGLNEKDMNTIKEMKEHFSEHIKLAFDLDGRRGIRTYFKDAINRSQKDDLCHNMALVSALSRICGYDNNYEIMTYTDNDDDEADSCENLCLCGYYDV